jgi:hypothetical protein
MTRLEAMKLIMANNELQIKRVARGVRSDGSLARATAPDSEVPPTLVRATFRTDPLRIFRPSADRGGE